MGTASSIACCVPATLHSILVDARLRHLHTAVLMDVPLCSLVPLYEEIEQHECARTVEMTEACFRRPLGSANEDALRPLLKEKLHMGDLTTALNRFLFRFLSSTAKIDETEKPLRDQLGCCWPRA